MSRRRPLSRVTSRRPSGAEISDSAGARSRWDGTRASAAEAMLSRSSTDAALPSPECVSTGEPRARASAGAPAAVEAGVDADRSAPSTVGWDDRRGIPATAESSFVAAIGRLADAADTVGEGVRGGGDSVGAVSARGSVTSGGRMKKSRDGPSTVGVVPARGVWSGSSPGSSAPEADDDASNNCAFGSPGRRIARWAPLRSERRPPGAKRSRPSRRVRRSASRASTSAGSTSLARLVPRSDGERTASSDAVDRPRFSADEAASSIGSSPGRPLPVTSSTLRNTRRPRAPGPEARRAPGARAGRADVAVESAAARPGEGVGRRRRVRARAAPAGVDDLDGASRRLTDRRGGEARGCRRRGRRCRCGQ